MVSVQVPLAVLAIVYVPPALVHAPELAKLTDNPEVADATTVKLLPFTTCGGAGVVTLIVWLAGVAFVDSVACGAAE
jgi:hypothetical protein